MRFASALFLCLVACEQKTAPAPASAPIAEPRPADLVIGEILPLTGPEAGFGFSARDGVELALRQANATGGVQGHKLVARVQDDRSRPEEASTAFMRLFEREKPIAVIGTLASSNTLAFAPLAQARRVPIVTPGSTAAKVTEVGDYVFRACFRDDFQGRVMAIFAAQDLKATKAAILRDKKSDYSVSLADEFAKAFTEFGGEVVADEAFLAGDVHFKAQLTKIRAKKPDVLFVPGYYTEVGLILRQARELGIDAKILGGDGWDHHALAEVAQKSASGSYFSTHFAADADNDTAKRFTQEFTESFGYEPNGLAAMGYEAARLVIEGLKRATTLDGPGLKDALAATKNFDALSGELSMNATRDPVKPAFVLQLGEDGRKTFATRIRNTGR